MEKIKDSDKNDQLYVSHIPQDIANLVLSELAVKTIYKFRSVCKLWSSLSSDPEFVEMHLTRSLHSLNVLVLSFKNDKGHRHTLVSFYSMDISETGNMAKLIFTVPLDVDLYSMAPSLNGLVCFTALLSKRIYVCNPSTHELSRLPNLHAKWEIAGFGCDYSTSTYKVLSAFVDLRNCSVEWYIYTLGSGDDSWRELGRMSFSHQIQPAENAYINGVAHWIIQGCDRSDPYGILSFNFLDESFWLLPTPNCQCWRLYLENPALHAAIHLKAMGGYLRLIATLDGTESGVWTICIWTLKDYSNYKWTYDFGFNINILDHNMSLYMPVPVDMRNGKMFFSSGNKFYSHDFERDVTAEIRDGIPAEDDVESSKDYQANFVESLVPVNSKSLF